MQRPLHKQIGQKTSVNLILMARILSTPLTVPRATAIAKSWPAIAAISASVPAPKPNTTPQEPIPDYVTNSVVVEFRR